MIVSAMVYFCHVATPLKKVIDVADVLPGELCQTFSGKAGSLKLLPERDDG
jgi:hypothetical protein